MTDALVAARLDHDLLARLDAWIARQREPLTRPQALRHLMENGLAADGL